MIKDSFFNRQNYAFQAKMCDLSAARKRERFKRAMAEHKETGENMFSRQRPFPWDKDYKDEEE